MGGGEGGEAGRGREPAVIGADGHTVGADELAEDDPAAWPGLESLPPEPPFEYPPPRPYRRRRSRDPERPALPPAGTVRSVPAATQGPAAAEPAPRSPSSPSRWWLVALVAAIVVLLLLPALVLLGRDDTEPEQAADTATTTVTTAAAPETSTTAPPELEPTPSTAAPLPPVTAVPDPPLDEAVVEVTAFVAEQRGFPTGEPVDAVRLPDEEFEARVREWAMLDPVAVEAQGDWLKLLGIIPADADYVAELLETYPKLVSGYFESEANIVVVRGEPGSPVDADLKELLAHEITHVLDTRELGLAGRVYDDPATEQQFGFDALVEGDAEWVESRWAIAHGRSWSPVDTDRYTDAVSSSVAATYELGYFLVLDIVGRGGLPQLNADFADPPSTSEQILHPEKYAVREPPVPLDAPTADDTPMWEGVTGEHTTGQMLRSVLPPEVADRAAAGWGNDKGVVWVQDPSEGGLTCLRIAYAMDTPADLGELEAAYLVWEAAEANRDVVREADTLLVTMCAPVPPPPVQGSSPA
jgi:hypothetical protein